MLKFIIYFLFSFISFYISYKFVWHVNMKNRKFVKQWEKEYISAYAEEWKKQYFKKLAEEKKIKECEKKIKLEKEETKEQLKQIHADDEFLKEFYNELDQAEKELEESEE